MKSKHNHHSDRLSFENRLNVDFSRGNSTSYAHRFYRTMKLPETGTSKLDSERGLHKIHAQ
jgi:hypothetical protein